MTTSTTEYRPAESYGQAPAYGPGIPAPRVEHPAVDRPVPSRPVMASPVIDQAQYWTGAVLTAAVSALVAALGIVVARGIGHIPLMIGTAAISPLAFALSAAGAALLVAALYDAMLHVAPRPTLYFSCLITVLTLFLAVLPFTSAMALVSAAVLALLITVVGLVVLLLVPMAAIMSYRVRAARLG